MDYGNWIETRNPFGLGKPPAHVLRDLFCYDPKAVIFASQSEPVYRFCRRASGMFPWEKFPPGHPDNPITSAHRLIPLKALLPKPQWAQVLPELTNYDVQQVGGGVAAADLLDQQDELKERRQQVAQDDECHARSGEAYRGLKAQMGERVHLGTQQHSGAGWTKNPLTTRTGRARRNENTYRPRGTGDHAIFVGR